MFNIFLTIVLYGIIGAVLYKSSKLYNKYLIFIVSIFLSIEIIAIINLITTNQEYDSAEVLGILIQFSYVMGSIIWLLNNPYNKIQLNMLKILSILMILYDINRLMNLDRVYYIKEQHTHLVVVHDSNSM